MAIVSTAEAGLKAAPRATVLQLRAPGLPTRDLEREAGRLVAESKVPVLISSRCDVALACRAAGVNLPEGDIGVEFARGLIRRGLIGRSVHSLEGAERAQVEGADFVIFGPVWESTTHPEGRPAGIETLARVAHVLRIPVVAIGGVTEARTVQCLAAGAAGYAGIRLFE
jgi:thiamine-phosphate pyrophosphorylase